jgi:4,5-DOPA dioxygenase extradiol
MDRFIRKIMTEKMPILFLGHGSPMNAIEDNEFSRGWKEVGKTLPKPNAVLCISAHWETRGTLITAMESPKTIHDFGGFPKELFDVQYPAPGSPELAKEIKEMIKKTEAALDEKWGLAKELLSLRRKGVLIIGSGNMVHNLRMVAWDKLDANGDAYDWAIEANDKMKKYILAGNHQTLINYQSQGNVFGLAIPTPEHFLPLLYVLALKEENDKVFLFNDKLVAGSLSMTSVKIGEK